MKIIKNKTIKCLLIIFMSFFVLITLTSCKQIEDINGAADFSIATINENELINSNKNITVMSSQSNNSEGGKFKAKTISGVMDLKKVNAEDNDIIINFNISVRSGNFEVIIIHNNKIYERIPANRSSTCTLEKSDETYIIKIAGESAEVELEYKFVTK